MMMMTIIVIIIIIMIKALYRALNRPRATSTGAVLGRQNTSSEQHPSKYGRR